MRPILLAHRRPNVIQRKVIRHPDAPDGEVTPAGITRFGPTSIRRNPTQFIPWRTTAPTPVKCKRHLTKLSKSSSKEGDAGEMRSVIRPPGQAAFTGFAVWQCAKGAYVINPSDSPKGKLMFCNPKRQIHIARYSDFASAWAGALKVGPNGGVVYA